MSVRRLAEMIIAGSFCRSGPWYSRQSLMSLGTGVQTSPDTLWHPEGATIRLDLTSCVPPATEIEETNPLPTPSTPQPTRSIPPTRYTDVVGQDAAVEAVRDLVELPLLHADLFKRIGARPQAHGILLAGPPGTGKTLLARAVAGECGTRNTAAMAALVELRHQLAAPPKILSRRPQETTVAWCRNGRNSVREARAIDRGIQLQPKLLISREAIPCPPSSRR